MSSERQWRLETVTAIFDRRRAIADAAVVEDDDAVGLRHAFVEKPRA